MDLYYLDEYRDQDDMDMDLLRQAARDKDIDKYIKLRQLVLLREIRDAIEEIEN